MDHEANRAEGRRRRRSYAGLRVYGLAGAAGVRRRVLPPRVGRGGSLIGLLAVDRVSLDAVDRNALNRGDREALRSDPDLEAKSDDDRPGFHHRSRAGRADDARLDGLRKHASSGDQYMIRLVE